LDVSNEKSENPNEKSSEDIREQAVTVYDFSDNGREWVLANHTTASVEFNSSLMSRILWEGLR
jgi:hypothetical protein